MEVYNHLKSNQIYTLTPSDWDLLNSYKNILSGIVLVYGPNCMAALYSAENSSFPCIAVENGQVEDLAIGQPLAKFPADALMDESHPGGKNVIGIYYQRTADDRSLKCVVNVIRNKHQIVIGALCISIDLSVPLHEFVRNFIPVVDNDLANGISDSSPTVNTIDDMIDHIIQQAIASANEQPALSVTERNRLIVHQLSRSGIFNIRGAISLVANELGVSRYTIYNYLKDIGNETEGS